MIKESLIALSLSCGSDLGTTIYGVQHGFKDRNLCHENLTCHAFTQGAYVGGGTLLVESMEERYGKKAGWATLGILSSVPIFGAVKNLHTIKKGKVNFAIRFRVSF